MKVLQVLILLTIVVVGVGFYRGWFTLSRQAPAAGSDNVNINLETDLHKMKQDVQAVKDKASGLTGNDADGGKSESQTNVNVNSNER
jgi:hypothetical protein